MSDLTWKSCKYCKKSIFCNDHGMGDHENVCKEKGNYQERKYKSRICPRCRETADRYEKNLSCACGWKLSIIAGGKNTKRITEYHEKN